MEEASERCPSYKAISWRANPLTPDSDAYEKHYGILVSVGERRIAENLFAVAQFSNYFINSAIKIFLAFEF